MPNAKKAVKKPRSKTPAEAATISPFTNVAGAGGNGKKKKRRNTQNA
jgi:hypothetical protein